MESNARAAIVGVTGFIGKGLPTLLAARGMAVTGVSRGNGHTIPGVDRWQTPDTLDFAGHHTVINLAGDPIDKRWTEENRRRFQESRVGLTTRIVEAIAKIPQDDRPKCS